MKKVWMMALPLMAAFTACSDDDGPKGPVVEYEVITFENCEFAEGAKNNVVKNAEFSYEDLGAKFVGQDYYSMYGGCVVSGAAKIQDSGTPVPLTVALPDDTEHAGADGSDKFCVLLKHDYVEHEPQVAFEDGVERDIVSFDVMNATDMYEYMKYGWYSYQPLAAGDWVEATFTGYDATGAETGSVTVVLADMRDGKDYIMEEWTSVDAVALGKVNKVVMTMKWSDEWAKPSPKNYTVCIDNIKMVKETETEE